MIAVRICPVVRTECNIATASKPDECRKRIVQPYDPRRAMTLAERIIARAAGRVRMVPGEIVTCRVDLAMMHDSGGPRRVKPMLDQLGVRVWDPERVVVVSDHYVPAFDADSAEILDLTRK